MRSTASRSWGPAVAPGAAEHVAGQALAVQPHQGRVRAVLQPARGGPRAETEREVLPAVEQAVEGERPCGGRGLLAEPERQEHLVANGGGGRKSHQHSSGGSGQNRGDSA
jgi:hypothetical protein